MIRNLIHGNLVLTMWVVAISATEVFWTIGKLVR